VSNPEGYYSYSKQTQATNIYTTIIASRWLIDIRPCLIVRTVFTFHPFIDVFCVNESKYIEMFEKK